MGKYCGSLAKIPVICVRVSKTDLTFALTLTAGLIEFLTVLFINCNLQEANAINDYCTIVRRKICRVTSLKPSSSWGRRLLSIWTALEGFWFEYNTDRFRAVTELNNTCDLSCMWICTSISSALCVGTLRVVSTSTSSRIDALASSKWATVQP